MGATTDTVGGSDPVRSVEIELTFDVDEETPLPDWGLVPGIEAVDAPELRELDARYFDTDALTLARSGYAVRRRTGGPDAGWHVKGPRVGDARVELGWPLGEAEDEVPDHVRDRVSSVATGALMPIARIRNTRTAYVLRDADGGVVAEFVDDRVTASDERAGIERRWREWEFELGPAAPTDADARALLFASVDSAVRAVGGRDAASDSKLARTLGH
ncbi:CYTH domain-containing protein [Microbacterium sp. SLBN-146]|uniref:CYTH domain-containing protein n=1 Tax=Microbacterium sp. SLBN-146 TaxID=2768457 RepID=UPI0011515950|nr:CYTH domain-containing protein [Microbacterium sp. SLBN-146]TQJ32395.1 CYTH domain-containing protein [Microbacterium sp. SLBN-146]